MSKLRRNLYKTARILGNVKATTVGATFMKPPPFLLSSGCFIATACYLSADRQGATTASCQGVVASFMRLSCPK